MMFKTLDFLLYAQRNEEVKKDILLAIESGEDAEICTDIQKLIFKAEEQFVHIEALSENSQWACKIFPAKMSYNAVKKVFNSQKIEFDTDELILK